MFKPGYRNIIPDFKSGVGGRNALADNFDKDNFAMLFRKIRNDKKGDSPELFCFDFSSTSIFFT